MWEIFKIDWLKVIVSMQQDAGDFVVLVLNDGHSYLSRIYCSVLKCSVSHAFKFQVN